MSGPGRLPVVFPPATDERLSSWIARMAPFYAMTVPGGGKYIRAYQDIPARKDKTQVTTNIHLDGRQVATSVTEHQSKAANAPASSAAGFDGRMGYASPSGVW